MRKISLNKVYAVVFLILAAWALVAFFTMDTLIESQHKYGKLINLSGKQRMLSQKTTLMAKRYFESSDSEFYEHLKTLYDEMKQDHSFIIANLTSEDIKKLYIGQDGLDAKVKYYFMLLSDFLQNPHSTQVQLLQEYAHTLLPHLNEAVYAFEEEGDNKIKSLQNRELLILIGTLLTLLIEALFLVRPVIKIVNAKREKLKNLVYEKTKRLEIFARVFENTMEGMLITDEEGTITAVNKAFTNITGYSQAEVLGKNPKILKSGIQDKVFYEQMWDSLKTKGSWKGEIINAKKDGTNIYEWLSIIRYQEKKTKQIYYLSVFYDITDQHEAKEHLEYVATHDYLTKLPNRNLLNDRLEQAIATSKRHKSKIAVVFMDLDNFKIINDTLGHDKGDELLQEISKRLLSHVREGDIVARIGGDEFVIVLEDIEGLDMISHYLQRLMDKINEPIYITSTLFQTTASVGISIYPDDAQNAKELLQFADTAMYHSKGIGKNNFSFFTQELNERVKKRLEMEQCLRSAIKNEEFELFLQPKINIATQTIIGAEALIRWRKNETLGNVPPDQFIPIAEESNQIHLISQWVCKQAGVYLERWQKHPVFQNLSIAINISPKEFQQPVYIQSLLAILKAFPFAPKLIVEITENTLVEDLQSAVAILQKIHSLGAKIAIDDFGTGYSSLSYLKKLPIDTLKIDRSFVSDIGSDKDSKIIVKTIIALAHSLGMNVVAEGVETAYQLDFMKSLNCEEAQGYYYAPAMPLEEFENWAEAFYSTNS